MVRLCGLVLPEVLLPPYSRAMGTEYSRDGRISITEVGGAEDLSTAQHQGWDGNSFSARRRNPFFLAAWALASAMLILGMSWLLFFARGVDVSQARYADLLPNQPEMVGTSPSPTLMNTLTNFVDVAPLLLVVGCLLSGLLLIVHGMNYRTRISGTS